MSLSLLSFEAAPPLLLQCLGAILSEKWRESNKKGCGAKMIAAVDGWVYFTDEEDPCITKPSHGDGGMVLQEQCTGISPFLLQPSDTPYLFLMRRYLV
jgi:hypothetical protein